MAKGCVKRGQVEMEFRTHGGKRRGAGRKPKGKRSGERHAARPEHDPRHPVHVTIRVVGNIDGLRRRDMYMALREATIVTARRVDFRIAHMSIQRDHVHLIVEADGQRLALAGRAWVLDLRRPADQRCDHRAAATGVPARSSPIGSTRVP